MKAHKQTDDTRLALLEQSIGHINQTLQRIEKRFDKIDNGLDSIEKNINQGFKEVNNRIWRNFYFMLAMYGGSIAIILKSVHYMINS
jgi:hypothetical protein